MSLTFGDLDVILDYIFDLFSIYWLIVMIK